MADRVTHKPEEMRTTQQRDLGVAFNKENHRQKKDHFRKARANIHASTPGEQARASWGQTRRFLGFSNDEAYLAAQEALNDPETQAEYERARDLYNAEQKFSTFLEGENLLRPVPLVLRPQGQELLHSYAEILGNAFSLREAISAMQLMQDRAQEAQQRHGRSIGNAIIQAGEAEYAGRIQEAAGKYKA
jgi:hypothetical protein